MQRRFLFVFIALFLGLSLTLQAAETHLFVSGANVRIRSNGSTSGKVVATLPLGTWAEILETGSEKQKLLGKDEFWYKIRDENRTEGWIFGGLTLRCTPETKFKTAFDLINERSELYGKPIEEVEQLYSFSKKMLGQARQNNDKAMMELGKLKALQQILNTLSAMMKGSDANHEAIKENKDDIYYHESAGQHFIYPEAFWKLAQTYKDDAIADEIAWQAARQQLPGETEGDPMAVLSFISTSEGKYLKMFPNGRYSAIALENIKLSLEDMPNFLNGYFTSEYEASKKAFLADLSDLGEISKTSKHQNLVTAINEAIEKIKKVVQN